LVSRRARHQIRRRDLAQLRRRSSDLAFRGLWKHQLHQFLLGAPIARFLDRHSAPGQPGRRRTLAQSAQQLFDWHLFSREDWKASPRLTVSLGFRYSVNLPFREDGDRIFNRNPFTNRLVVPRQRSVSYLNSALVANRAVELQFTSEADLPERRLVRTDFNNPQPARRVRAPAHRRRAHHVSRLLRCVLSPAHGPDVERACSRTVHRKREEPDNPDSGRYPDLVASAPIPAYAYAGRHGHDWRHLRPPPSGRSGNSATHILEGPSSKLWNAGVFRTFPVWERVRLRLEAKFTNVTKTPNFGQPATDLANRATAGRINSLQFVDTAGARTTRLGLRVEF
jgi:hypothetical protein